MSAWRLKGIRRDCSALPDRKEALARDMWEDDPSEMTEAFMLSRLAALGTTLVVLSWTLAAQDVSSVLQRAGTSIGGMPKSIQYSGTGANYQLGQSVRPGGPWPRYIVK